MIDPDSGTVRSSDELIQLLDGGDAAALVDYLHQLSGVELARIVSHLSPDEQVRFWTTLPAEQAADHIEELSTAQAAGVIEQLPVAHAAAILEELPSDERADVLNEIDEPTAEAVLARFPSEEAAWIRRLTEYDADVAGGLMITEFLAFPAHLTVGELIDELRAAPEDYSEYEVQYIYVVDDFGRLEGVLRLRDLLLTPNQVSISKIMLRAPVAVRDDTDLVRLERLFDHHPFLAIPVTDADGILLGVLRRFDVEEAVESRSGGEFLRSQGIVGGEELRSMPLRRRAGRRLSWLSVNILLNIAAASVIAAYQDTLAVAIALAVFLPIISDMSGCSGNQAVAVSIRELSLGLLLPRDYVRVWLKEITVGLINGAVLGLLLGLAAYLWKHNLYLSLVVTAAMAINTLIAVSIGGLIPLLLRRLRLDPALASGPLLTTVTDMCGFFLVLSLATMVLSRLA
ncbi:MAG: magnesium transporter [Candidatus Eisenbacteria bacterium]|uniref:Magnesium transporter MgtE n=1 Tax=Eiseniibacteriota bacterium TaxID=2212470 RepID=A0A956RQU8_UNCEI|nr:magnesium transporter [Candidatus Eisenbacteria bacterium]